MKKRFFARYKNNTTPTPVVATPNSTPPPSNEAEKLGFFGLAKNLVTSLSAWQRAGRPVVTSEQWDKRLAICRGCPFWQELGNSKVARCKKCGCSSGKLLLATSRCPLNPPKWSEEPH